MHIFNMLTTGMQGFKKIHHKLYTVKCDKRTDRQTGANLNAPEYRHGGIKTRHINNFKRLHNIKIYFCDGAVIRNIAKIFCTPEKKKNRTRFLPSLPSGTAPLSSLDRFIVLIWKTDVDSRISIGSPWTHTERKTSRYPFSAVKWVG